MKIFQQANKFYAVVFVALIFSLLIGQMQANGQTTEQRAKSIKAPKPEDAFRARHGKPQYPQPAQTPKPEDLRIVNGQLYNIQISNLWKARNFEYVRRDGNLVIAKEITFKDIYKEQWVEGDAPLNSLQQSGAYYGGPPIRKSGWRNVRVGTERVVGPSVSITNLTRTDLAVGKDFTIATMIIETSQTNRMSLHDVGTLFQPGLTATSKP